MASYFNPQLYPIVKIAFMMIMGIIAGNYLQCHNSQIYILAIMALLIFVAVLKPRSWLVQSIAIYVCFFLYGCYMTVNASKESSGICFDKPTLFKAVVLTTPIMGKRTFQTDLLVVDSNNTYKIKSNIMAVGNGKISELKIGDGIEVWSVPRSIDDNVGDGVSKFNYQTWLRTNGYKARTFIANDCWRRCMIDVSHVSILDKLRLFSVRLRRTILDNIRCLGLTGSELSIVSAMAFGDKSYVDRDLRDDYSNSGMSHLLALSGLHLSIIYGMLLFLVYPFRRKILTQASVILAIWVYVILVGMPYSVVRAATMLTFCSLAFVLSRNHLSVNILALAAIVILSFSPHALNDVGFQLSFLAMLSIYVIMPLIHGMKYLSGNILNLLWRWLKGTVCVTLSVMIGTSPLVAYYFGIFSPISPIANILVLPIATILLYMVMILLIPIPMLQSVVVKVVAILAKTQNDIVEFLSSLSISHVKVNDMGIITLFSMYVLIISLVVIAYIVRRRYSLYR